MASSEINPVIKCAAISIPATVLFFIPGYFDPINLPKLLILIPIAFTSLVLIYALRKYVPRPIASRERLIIYALYATLAISMLISGLGGSDNFVRVIFGASGRNNGLMYYLLAIILAFTLLISRITEEEVAYFHKAISFTSIIFTVYCSVQLFDLDPVGWSNPYNKVIGTLGNPNFSASALAIFAGYWIYRFSRFSSESKPRKTFAITLSIYMLFLSWSTDSLQGLVVFLLALILNIYIRVREKFNHRALPPVFFLGGSLSFLLVFASFLGLGPAGNFLEQYTLKLRAWYALFGIRAIWDSPIFGVGVDNYVSAFRTFRTKEFVAQYGSELSANNAHSSPIQIGASFGLVVFSLYCIIQIWILMRALSIINSRDSKLPNLKGISIIWLLVFSQSLLSIEIIGLGVMNWVLGAVILSSNIERSSEIVAPSEYKPRNLKTKGFPIWTGSLVIASMSIGSLVFVPISIEDKAFQNIAFLQVDSTVSKELVVKNYQKLTKFSLYYPNKLDAVANNLFAAGLTGEIEKSVKELYRVDKNDAYAVYLLATYYLNSEDLTNEIKIREELQALDPWNEKLELALARAYSKAIDLEGLNRSIDRIKALSPDSPEYLEALALLRK